MSEQTWYAINMKAEPQGEAEVCIYDAIGSFGVGADRFIKDLKAIKARTINLRINTPGGEVFAATAMYNAIREHPARVVVHIDGLAASAGSFVATAGDEVRMADNAYMMIHEARGGVMGRVEDVRSYATSLDKINDTVAGMYEKKAGKSRDHWRGLMDAETWFTAEEAKAAGLVDVVYAAAPAKTPARAAFDFTIYNKIPDGARVLLGLTPTNSPAPEDSQRSDPPPATTKETQLMAEASTQAAPAQNSAAGSDPVTTQSNTPNPAPVAAAAPAMTQDQQIANLRTLTAAGYVEQGKKVGIDEGRRLERERLDAIVAACPGKPQLALDTFLRGQDAVVAKLTYEAETRADNRAKEIEKSKDLEIQRLNALLATGGSPGVALSLAGIEDTGPAMEPKAQAEYEWENKPEVRKTARTKEIYVMARTAELDGTHRSFQPANA